MQQPHARLSGSRRERGSAIERARDCSKREREKEREREREREVLLTIKK
jgi:hypothetical protein